MINVYVCVSICVWRYQLNIYYWNSETECKRMIYSLERLTLVFFFFCSFYTVNTSISLQKIYNPIWPHEVYDSDWQGAYVPLSLNSCLLLCWGFLSREITGKLLKKKINQVNIHRRIENNFYSYSKTLFWMNLIKL